MRLHILRLHFNVALEKKREKQTKEKVLIVCGSGRASSELLRYQIEEKFGKNLVVVGTASLNTLHIKILMELITF